MNFYLDGAGPLNTENFVHWDFQGTTGVGPTDPANPWDTSSAAAGAHTIVANSVLANGETVNISADFSIS